MNNPIKVGAFVGHNKITKIVYKFPVLHEGWELDSEAAIVKLDNGVLAIVGTDHGYLKPLLEKDLEDYIKKYEDVIAQTKEALALSAADTTITRASNELYRMYSNQPWFHSIGVTPPINDRIIIYLSKKKGHPDLSEYKGYKLEWKYVGKIVPL